MIDFIDEKERSFSYRLSEDERPENVKKKLKDEKLFAWDGHVHSFYSRDVKERKEFHPASIFFTGLKRGMDYVTITDHNEYGQNEVVAEVLKDRPELLNKFIPGTEFTVDDKNLGHVIHVNVYLLTREDFEILMRLRKDLVSFIKYCTKKDLPFQYNHPFWFELGHGNKILEKNFEAVLKYGKLFPVIEISNSNRAVYENLAGEILAKILKKGGTSSSDGHFGDIGSQGYTLARGKNFREFWKNISEGKSHLVKQNLRPERLRGYVLKTVDFLAYQTKIKQVGGKYRMETGSKKLGALMSFFDKFPLTLRLIRPYVKARVRKTKLIEAYVENQNVIGRRAIDFFNRSVSVRELPLRVTN